MIEGIGDVAALCTIMPEVGVVASMVEEGIMGEGTGDVAALSTTVREAGDPLAATTNMAEDEVDVVSSTIVVQPGVSPPEAPPIIGQLRDPISTSEGNAAFAALGGLAVAPNPTWNRVAGPPSAAARCKPPAAGPPAIRMSPPADAVTHGRASPDPSAAPNRRQGVTLA